MAQIKSDFPALPDNTDPTWPAVYGMVYDQLTAMGLPLPAQPYNLISRAGLLKHLQQQAGKMVKEELKRAADPDYTGKTDGECAGMLNGYHSPGDWHRSTVPIHRIFQGLPFAPNSLTEDDVKEAKKNGD